MWLVSTLQLYSGQDLDGASLFQLFTDCRLIDRVLSAWEENENPEQQAGFQRKGYMAHLTRIANALVSQLQVV